MGNSGRGRASEILRVIAPRPASTKLTCQWCVHVCVHCPQNFNTVMAAIGSHPAHTDVVLELLRCEKRVASSEEGKKEESASESTVAAAAAGGAEGAEAAGEEGEAGSEVEVQRAHH